MRTFERRRRNGHCCLARWRGRTGENEERGMVRKEGEIEIEIEINLIGS